MILPILTWPHESLLKPTQPWDFDNPPLDYDSLERTMITTMMACEALGLAANQVGYPYRFFAMNLTEYEGRQFVLYNPEILEVSEDLWDNDEGCLSFPKVFLKIARPKTVVAKYKDRHNREHIEEFSNMDAKCFLHELDHLNGVVFKKYVSDLKFNTAVRKSKKY